MKRDEYYAAIEAYKKKKLEHGEWKKHKYIRIENGRYIYPEDLKKDKAAEKSSNEKKINETAFGKKVNPTVTTLYPKDKLPNAKEKIEDDKHDLDILKRLTDAGQLEDKISDEEYAKRKAELDGRTRTVHELSKRNAELDKDLKNLDELEKHQETVEKYRDNKIKEGIAKEVARLKEESQKLSPQEQYKKEQSEKKEKETAEKKAEGEARKAGREVTEAEKNLKEMARKYAHYADLTKNVSNIGSSVEWSNLVKAAKEYAEETGEDYRKVLEKALADSKKVQHSFETIDEYKAAIADYKARKHLRG